jgi:hypothetical protein
MFAGFQGGKPIDPRFADELVRPLTSFPDDVMLQTIDNFRHGRVAGMDMHFPPSIPEIVVEARRLMPRHMDTPELLEAPTISSAERKRMGKKLVQLATKLRGPVDLARAEALEKRRLALHKANTLAMSRDTRPISERLRFRELGIDVDEKVAGG